ncbi:MAG: ABC transporter permease [Oscillospiraceae bacterium]|nr:ABC transporter permease [Oscillospiraceae bacterium]
MGNDRSLRRVIKSKNTVLIAILAAVVLMFYLLNSNYLSGDNLRGVMQSMSITGIMAVGAACLLIGGGIDLATSMEALFGGVLCGLLIKAGIPWPLSVLLTLAAGGLIGGAVAYLVAHLGMMPFIASIALSNVIRGVNLVMTNAQNVPVPTEGFWVLGSSNVLNIIPTPFVIMLILLVIYGLVLHKTQFGRNIYLIGGNQFAARLSGLSPKKIRTILYVNNGVLAAFSGIVVASRMHSASPSSLSDSQMDAITAAILGGVSFMGGSGGMGGCLIGILLLNFFNNGLNVLSLESHWQTIAQGALLIAALTMDYFNEKSREKSLKAGAALKQ